MAMEYQLGGCKCNGICSCKVVLRVDAGNTGRLTYFHEVKCQISKL